MDIRRYFWKHGKVLAKRFGLRQGEKLRVIDDCSIAGLNFLAGLLEKFQLHTMDQLAAMVSRILNRVQMARGLDTSMSMLYPLVQLDQWQVS